MFDIDIARLLTTENAIALLTLALLEIVLGIDNIVFIAILTGRLPVEQRSRARKVGLFMAMGTRVLLLLSLAWIMKLTRPLFVLLGHGISGRDLILLLGGLFLLAKATLEIHHRVEGAHETQAEATGKGAVFGAVIAQIMVLDIVFSLDSVITAVGMAKEVSIMVLAVMVAVGVMMVFADAVSNFIEHHPTIKVLALSFLLAIGVMLTAEGLGRHIEKGYLYFAMAFSLGVEMLNIRAGRNRHAVAQVSAAGPDEF